MIANLVFIYRVLLASVALLEFAAERSEGELKDYYEKHIGEEFGHAEMLLHDLKRLGVEEIDRYHAAAQFAGSQYYLIACDHPALLLGYMHLLESNAPTMEVVEALEKEHGVTLNCLRHHATHDPQHKEDIETLIAAQEPEIQELIAWNEQNCAMLLTGVFKEMYGNRAH